MKIVIDIRYEVLRSEQYEDSYDDSPEFTSIDQNNAILQVLNIRCII